MKKDVKILKFLINFSFFEKDNTVTAKSGKISKRINGYVFSIYKIGYKEKQKGEKWDSNPQHLDPQSNTLPIKL